MNTLLGRFDKGCSEPQKLSLLLVLKIIGHCKTATGFTVVKDALGLAGEFSLPRFLVFESHENSN
jgi:hypothetical protein